MARSSRELLHRQFVTRVHSVFAFLVDVYQFELVKPAKSSRRFLEREVDVFYSKDPTVAFRFVCEGIYQAVLLQGGRDGAFRQRGLHRVIQLRCPHLTIPRGTDEQSLTEELVFCADALQKYFADFLEGDPSILYEPLS
jgi:hypothetical protein